MVPVQSRQLLVDRAVKEFGHLDVMCTNAGALRGTITCGRAAARRFREQGDGGRLILIGSPAGQSGGFGGDRFAIWAHPAESFVTHRDGGWTPAQLAADFAEYTQHLQRHTKAK